MSTNNLKLLIMFPYMEFHKIFSDISTTYYLVGKKKSLLQNLDVDNNVTTL